MTGQLSLYIRKELDIIELALVAPTGFEISYCGPGLSVAILNSPKRKNVRIFGRL
jgi:hypothetical protein